MRVLVFRAAEAAARTAKSLVAAGHDPVLAPLTTIAATMTALPAGRFQAILATSANAFEPTAAAAYEIIRGLPVFAVGTATRDAALRRGFRDVRVSDGDAAALVALVRLTLPAPARLLYLAGRDRKPAAEQSLRAAGYTVMPAVLYAAEATDRWPDDLADRLRTGDIDAALHFSRRSAELALALARRQNASASFTRLAQLCLSEDVAAPLREAGAADIRVAATPDEAALLKLLAPARS